MRRRFGRSMDEDALPSAPGARVQGSMDVERAEHEAVVTAYTQELRRREKNRAEEPIWNWRCSLSVIGAIAIWCMIALVVLHMIGRAQTRSVAEHGYVTGEMFAKGDLTSQGSPPRGAANADMAPLPDGCWGAACHQEGGTEPFGSILGTHNGVFAFGNCFHSTCISMLESRIDVPISEHVAQRLRESVTAVPDGDSESRVVEKDGRFLRNIASGMKWQCVEYARRYWMLAGHPEPAYFGDVEGAADIWDLSTAYLLDDTPMPMLKYVNGRALGTGGDAPRVGDLVLYDRNASVVPYGHVAVVVGVEEASLSSEATPGHTRDGVVYLAEQNWHNVPWPGPYHNHSRAVPLRLGVDGAGRRTYTMEDAYIPIKGWVRYGRA